MHRLSHQMVAMYWHQPLHLIKSYELVTQEMSMRLRAWVFLLLKELKKVGISAVAFDRSGYKYHGRVKALADAAREAGLKF